MLLADFFNAGAFTCTRPSGASRTRAIISYVATFLIAVLLSTVVFVLHQPSSMNTLSQPTTKHLNCGNSTAEARAKGCVFDVLTNMWVPEPCWDREDTEEFMRTAPWQSYNMQDGKRLLTLEEMSERVGKDQLAPNSSSLPHGTPLREHWFLSGNSNMPVFHSLSYQHTVHYSNSLVHMAGAGDKPPDPLDMVGIRTWVGFSERDVEL
ncbi:hypothetical protein K458DRAFT_438148 [Lentithecium fluviatile CBS 122367]|uniref:Uncharacterized protein n=1 Tax=Lentithecium fluviatile CBS 122367 TaxID=1168545 RepID=A0A6G1JMK6_9PLEO|nr:hypothetical protein K458DRAFT_438148 [Lentithecium fluviatile CBS 122367]